MSSLEPPDISILKDRSQLEFYISALERWANIAKASGIADTLLADFVLAHAFKQAPELCKEMSDHFDDALRNDSEGIEKIVNWLKAKFSMNKHADMVKVRQNVRGREMCQIEGQFSMSLSILSSDQYYM